MRSTRQVERFRCQSSSTNIAKQAFNLTSAIHRPSQRAHRLSNAAFVNGLKSALRTCRRPQAVQNCLEGMGRWFESSRARRGIGFEDVVFHIERGDLLDILEHSNPDRTPASASSSSSARIRCTWCRSSRTSTRCS